MQATCNNLAASFLASAVRLWRLRSMLSLRNQSLDVAAEIAQGKIPEKRGFPASVDAGSAGTWHSISPLINLSCRSRGSSRNARRRKPQYLASRDPEACPSFGVAWQPTRRRLGQPFHIALLYDSGRDEAPLAPRPGEHGGHRRHIARFIARFQATIRRNIFMKRKKVTSQAGVGSEKILWREKRVKRQAVACNRSESRPCNGSCIFKG